MEQLGIWEPDWLVGAVMTVGTVVFHIIGLGLIHLVFLRILARLRGSRHNEAIRSLLLLTPVVAMIFLLHALESFSWAATYVLFGATDHWREAVVYSMGALSTYGHDQVYLRPEWALLGAIQALNGMLIFGLTIAFLAAVIRQVWAGAPI
ncbi:hypothetical protein [Roseomonas sp. AR75]|uniref:hypothetical protein n=1 Tax=Roseomonas sp. AR75 TaxID=2562311 RepID=UPI0010C02315|nr:hypothetical protein [Roseomonas sp. AR75]